MATNQAVVKWTIAHTAVEAVKAAVQTMAVAVSEGNSWARSEPTSTGHNTGWQFSV